MEKRERSQPRAQQQLLDHQYRSGKLDEVGGVDMVKNEIAMDIQILIWKIAKF